MNFLKNEIVSVSCETTLGVLICVQYMLQSFKTNKKSQSAKKSTANNLVKTKVK